jgi:hypothetical protein
MNVEVWNMNSNPQVPAKESVKKLYQRPRLKVHGDIKGLTRTVSNTSVNMDGGAGAFNKTH